MRSFGGDLGLVNLADLLQLLSTNRPRGFLTVSNGDQKKSIQFCTGGIRLVSGVRRTNPLGQVLLRNGGITSAQLKELLEEQQKTKSRRLGDIAAERGVSRESLDQALRDQAAEEIYELFNWTDAKFFFVEAATDALPQAAGPLASVLLDMNVMSLMIEAARRTDEMARIRAVIPDDTVVPVKTDVEADLDDPNLDRNAASEILSLIDGAQTVDQIVLSSVYPKFTVLRTLYELMQRGAVQLAGKESQPAGPSSDKPTVIRRLGLSARDKAILVISPLESFREALALSLKQDGYSVLTRESWDPSQASFVSAWIDAIVLDISFEGDEAMTVCDRIRQDAKKPFIVLSENTSPGAYESALQCGARYILLKPINDSVLLERLASMLGLPLSRPASP